jgi:hypothetical protein
MAGGQKGLVTSYNYTQQSKGWKKTKQKTPPKKYNTDSFLFLLAGRHHGDNHKTVEQNG